ncbi:MAG TPA: ParA family protein [bacterium]|nr:ParA family protein [bacterium]HNT65255.1 ParA family protein [bacterium]HOX86942.1 ParA family protein [bacterium]HPG46273.1 ParA family protein [bacterium]HPM98533.1 ParA family protein [bacterium]
MKIIVVLNNKGGVGKTTSAVNIAAWCARLGKKTLIADFDPSAGTSRHLGFDPDVNRVKTLCDYLVDENRDLNAAIHSCSEANLSCLPAEPALSDFYLEVANEEENHFFINREQIPEEFELLFCDCPPNMGPLAMNALAIADYALVPVQAQFLALAGLAVTDDLLDKTRRHLNPHLQILGYFVTHFDRRTRSAAEIFELLQQRYGPLLLQQVIGMNVKLVEAARAGQPILSYAPRARGTQEYGELTRALLTRIGV